ncbi:MAG: transposase, partial [Acetatifactor sp.]|nr:transposase [Acetatifactor sp.]
MGEKDLTQKVLESFPDVFADCVNALLYESEEMASSDYLRSDSLVIASTESIYRIPGKPLQNQFEDIGMYEMDGKNIVCLYMIENQTTVDRKMILRKLGYEGA